MSSSKIKLCPITCTWLLSLCSACWCLSCSEIAINFYPIILRCFNSFAGVQQKYNEKANPNTFKITTLPKLPKFSNLTFIWTVGCWVKCSHQIFACDSICCKRAYAIAIPSVCLSICLSFCLSVTRVIHAKLAEVRIMQLSPYSSPIPLVFAR